MPNNRTYMNDLVVVEKQSEWQRLKALVLDSVSSPLSRRAYNMALDDFIRWFKQAPRPGLSKATVSAWRTSTRLSERNAPARFFRCTYGR
jgi:hypothetical protein